MATVGRPTVMTPEVIETIEKELKNGATLAQASFLAGISLKTIYNYFETNPSFKDRSILLQGMVAYRARVNIKNKIEGGDIDTSKYWLDRKDKDFKPKSDLTSDDEQIAIAGFNYIKQNDKDNTNDKTTTQTGQGLG